MLFCLIIIELNEKGISNCVFCKAKGYTRTGAKQKEIQKFNLTFWHLAKKRISKQQTVNPAQKLIKSSMFN
jgi:hypothetical protein